MKLFEKQISKKWLLIGIVIGSVVLRFAAALYLGDQVVDMPGTFDQISYHKLALRVLGGFGFSFDEIWWPMTPAGAPTAHWSYLYTFYLVATYAVFGPHPLAARILQAVVVGTVQPLLIYHLGKRLFGSSVGIAASILIAVYAYFIYYAACLMTESFYITAIMGALYLAIQIVTPSISLSENQIDRKRIKQGIYLGLCLGIVVLLRQLFLLFLPVLFFWMVGAGRKEISKIIRSLIPTVVIVAVMILPFTAYNYSRFGKFVLLNTNSGFAFFWGNHPIHGTHFISVLPIGWEGYMDLIPQELHNLDEASLDQELFRYGLKFISDDPNRIILLSISRIPSFFMFWPTQDSSLVSNLFRVLSFGVLWPFMLFGLIRALVGPFPKAGIFSPTFLLFLFAIFYLAIHLASWALIRYRLPIDAILLIFAGLAFRDLIQYSQNIKHKIFDSRIPAPYRPE